MNIGRSATRSILILSTIVAISSAGIAIATTGDENEPRVDKSLPQHEFPQNEQGLTYGSAADATSPENEPDLILAYGTNGVMGYVKKVELDEPAPRSPEEAALATPEIRTINLYALDGSTIIGQFSVGGGKAQIQP